MINTTTSMSSTLASIYGTTNDSLNKTLARISSGKRIQTPGDDFAGYIRSSALQTDINSYNTLKQSMQDGKAYTDYGKAVGNNILADLVKMKDIASSYANLSVAEKAGEQGLALGEQYDALATGITSQAANSKYDGVAVYVAANVKTVNTDIQTVPSTIAITPTAIASTGLLNVAAGVAAVQAQIVNAETYISEMESFGTQLERAIKLADTVINSKTATVSAITDINDTEELSKLTNLQVRQQATVSMMSQANSAQAAIAKLFQ